MADTLTHLTARKPAWLKVPAPGGPNSLALKHLMRDLKLHTVCEEAHCPNIGECGEHGAATFMILGDVCTRNCAYCAVAHGTPAPLDTDEPARLGAAVEQMELRHVVITSVDRDDLPNGGAEMFAAAIAEIRRRRPGTSVEGLIPDFKGSEQALRIRSEEHTSELQSQSNLVCRLLLETKKKILKETPVRDAETDIFVITSYGSVEDAEDSVNISVNDSFPDAWHHAPHHIDIDRLIAIS